MKKVVHLLSLALIIVSCKNETKPTEHQSLDSIPKASEIDIKTEKPDAIDAGYMDFTVNDTLAERIGDFLKNDHLKSDYELLTDVNRKFQLAEIDLNNDGKNEVFVNFFTNYYCGTGGCSLLLLDSDMNIITKFTVTRTPLFIQKELLNGWNTILVQSQGKFVKLIHDTKGYPPNPSVVKPVDYAPSGHDLVLFDDNFSPSKTYTF